METGDPDKLGAASDGKAQVWRMVTQGIEGIDEHDWASNGRRREAE
jgi:hypothetical protein